MKKFIIIIGMLFLIVGCTSSRMESASIEDCGKLKVGPNLYLKKIVVSYTGYTDRVYFFVDDDDKIVSGASASYMVGKAEQNTSSVIAINPKN